MNRRFYTSVGARFALILIGLSIGIQAGMFLSFLGEIDWLPVIPLILILIAAVLGIKYDI